MIFISVRSSIDFSLRSGATLHAHYEPNAGRGAIAATATAIPVSPEEAYADRRKLLSSLRER